MLKAATRCGGQAGGRPWCCRRVSAMPTRGRSARICCRFINRGADALIVEMTAMISCNYTGADALLRARRGAGRSAGGQTGTTARLSSPAVLRGCRMPWMTGGSGIGHWCRPAGGQRKRSATSKRIAWPPGRFADRDDLREARPRHGTAFAQATTLRPAGTGARLAGARKDEARFPVEVRRTLYRSNVELRGLSWVMRRGDTR